MKRIMLNNWYIKDNSLQISLLRFHVTIKLECDNGLISYEMDVVDNDMKHFIFNLYSLENAISFVENVINKCMSRTEIMEKYMEMYEKNEIKKLSLMKKRK